MGNLLLGLWLALTCSSCLVFDWNGDGIVRIAAAGDSNTEASAEVYPWCDRLADLHGEPLQWFCFGQGGARAIGNTYPWHASVMLDTVLAAAPDVVMLAFGTNDLFFDNALPADVFAALQSHAARIEAAGAVAVLAAIPPINDISPTKAQRIVETNALIAAWRPARTIDFFTDFAPFLTPDGAHFTATGQALRAERAAAVLW